MHLSFTGWRCLPRTLCWIPGLFSTAVWIELKNNIYFSEQPVLMDTCLLVLQILNTQLNPVHFEREKKCWQMYMCFQVLRKCTFCDCKEHGMYYLQAPHLHVKSCFTCRFTVARRPVFKPRLYTRDLLQITSLSEPMSLPLSWRMEGYPWEFALGLQEGLFSAWHFCWVPSEPWGFSLVRYPECSSALCKELSLP